MMEWRIGAPALAVFLGLAFSSSCSSQPGGVAGALHFDASTAPDAQRDAGEADAPVETPTPPSCDPTTTPSDGVFVSPTGNDNAQGTKLAPLKTIAAGLVAMHQSSKSTLYLAEGTYHEELALSAVDSGVIIDGGWTRLGGAWQRDCSVDATDKTLIASPSNVGASLDPGVIATLRHLAITTETRGASEPGQPGESCYGILAQGGATLFMTDVNVTAGSGGPGGAAMPGLQPATPTCNGETDCSDGATGNTGKPGSAASASGSFDTTGYSPESGTDGAAGDPGHNGTPGQPGGTGSCSTSCGAPPCDPGVTTTGVPGTCGCGGGGGAPGGRGQGGGASVGVLAMGATTTVSVTASDITAQDGGNGSPGGKGGGGQAGTSGVTGPPTSCTLCVAILSTCLPEPNTLSGGTAGGDGGVGGPGGRGGAGAGGPSYAIVTVGGAAVNADAASALAFGNGGQGAGQAASGAAAKRLNVP